MQGPRTYRNLAEFEREEIQPHKKYGWSLDDLYQEATFKGTDDEAQEEETQELDFG